MGLCAVPAHSLVARFLIVFWLVSVLFLLNLPFFKMKYPMANCSQIVLIDCRQMAIVCGPAIMRERQIAALSWFLHSGIAELLFLVAQYGPPLFLML